MSNRCPTCGAHLLTDHTCQSIFDECMALELTDPAFGKVHMLTVACFMLQHGRYSDEALTWIVPQIRDHLAGVPVQYIRQRAHQGTQQANRSWKVVRSEDDQPLSIVSWSVTIADILPTLHDANAYCSAVEHWARATLQDMPHTIGETE